MNTLHVVVLLVALIAYIITAQAQEATNDQTAQLNVSHMSQKLFFEKMIGRWEGNCRTWFEQGKLGDESEVMGEITEALDGQFLCHTYEGIIRGKRRRGEEGVAWLHTAATPQHHETASGNKLHKSITELKEQSVKHVIHSVVLAGLVLVWAGAQAQDKAKSDTNQIPKRVMDGLQAKFPKPAVDKWTKEKEGDIVVYDIEFKQGGQKFEADIKEDGTIHNWEKAITPEKLPAAVKKSIVKKYPASAMKEVMEITAVTNGKDKLEGYEIVLRTPDKKDVEVTVAPDGKIMEDSGEKK